MAHFGIVCLFVLLVKIVVDIFHRVFDVDSWMQKFRQSLEIPLAYFGLSFVSVASTRLVGVIANEVWVKVFHPGVRTVVNG